MDAQHQDVTLNSGKDRPKSCENQPNLITQTVGTTETATITVQPDSLSAKSTCSNGIGHRGSEESLNDIVVTSEDALLLPDHVPVIAHKIEKESSSPLSGLTPPDAVTNGLPPICTPPTASTRQRAPDPAQVPKCNGHSQPHKKHLPSTSKSHQSLKANAAQIQQVAGDDCCVHCILACLFCEVLSLCSALTQCLACGLECDAACCCGDACCLACCSEDPCSALLDCAILEDCCQSSDCLEICLECCSICFPA